MSSPWARTLYANGPKEASESVTSQELTEQKSARRVYSCEFGVLSGKLSVQNSDLVRMLISACWLKSFAALYSTSQAQSSADSCVGWSQVNLKHCQLIGV